MLYTITNTGSTNARPSAIGANSIAVDFEGEHGVDFEVNIV